MTIRLVWAHGPGDDAENERWLANLDARAAAVRKALPFHRVAAMTLREDWPDKREAAERKTRDFMSQAAKEGRRTLVIPFRLLEIVADRHGLLPYADVTQWIARQADELRAGPFRTAAERPAHLVHGAKQGPMCRNIKPLFNFEPPVTDGEVRAAALQFVRKVTGFNKPSKANEAAFETAIDEIAAVSRKLLGALETSAPPKDRAIEAAKARERSAQRFAR